MVKIDEGQRHPLSAITNLKNLNTEPKSKRNFEYISDGENSGFLMDKTDSTIDDNSFCSDVKRHDCDQILINLEDSSSSSCCLKNISSINITSSTITSSISSTSNKNQKSKKKVQFISNEALDKAEFTNDSKYSKIRLNTLPVNNYANHNRYPKAIINHYNSSFQSKNRPFTTRPVMSSSTTMPSISNVFSNQYSQLKTNYSSYAICESDNPFRPEGSLAKEADEFIKELNTKKEREVSEIIKNTSLNNSNTLSVNELMHQPSDAELARTANEPHKPAEKPDVVSLPEATKPETREPDSPAPVEQPQPPSTENGQKKKKKVKSKCGCIIS